jgi:hypothetical protein
VPYDNVTEADTNAAARSVAIDLHEPLRRLGAIDGIYIVVEDVPAGVRLSAGRFNGDSTWSLGPGEIDGLRAVLPARLTEPFVLSARILTPDPCGYEYASTTARVDIAVDPGGAAALVAAPETSTWPRVTAAIADSADDPTAAATRRLAAARADWEADEAYRFAQNRARWDAAEQERWREREAALRAEAAAALTAAEARWKQREAMRVAAVEAQWSARLAAGEARCRAEKAQRRAASAPAGSGGRRLAASLAAAIGFSCIAAAAWML